MSSNSTLFLQLDLFLKSKAWPHGTTPAPSISSTSSRPPEPGQTSPHPGTKFHWMAPPAMQMLQPAMFHPPCPTYPSLRPCTNNTRTDCLPLAEETHWLPLDTPYTAWLEYNVDKHGNYCLKTNTSIK